MNAGALIVLGVTAGGLWLAGESVRDAIRRARRRHHD